MILQRLLGRKSRSAETLYRAIVTAARQPRFYAEWAVPDTVDGRFDMIVLHLFLVLDRLRGENDQEQLAQALTDAFFADMDRSLREMAEAYYGRVTAYGKALEGTGNEFEQALTRNVFAGQPQAFGAGSLSVWAKEVREKLRAQPAAAIAAGDVRWS
jgi:cytochrome b pre-mRNA-processing protein 3